MKEICPGVNLFQCIMVAMPNNPAKVVTGKHPALILRHRRAKTTRVKK